jgi:hypothetical protein
MDAAHHHTEPPNSSRTQYLPTKSTFGPLDAFSMRSFSKGKHFPRIGPLNLIRSPAHRPERYSPSHSRMILYLTRLEELSWPKFSMQCSTLIILEDQLRVNYIGNSFLGKSIQPHIDRYLQDPSNLRWRMREILVSLPSPPVP